MEPARGLFAAVRETLRTRHMSCRTEQANLGWARRFVRFHGRRHPQEPGPADVGPFLTHLAVQRNVSASTRSKPPQALFACIGGSPGRICCHLMKSMRLPFSACARPAGARRTTVSTLPLQTSSISNSSRQTGSWPGRSRDARGSSRQPDHQAGNLAAPSPLYRPSTLPKRHPQFLQPLRRTNIRPGALV